MLNKISISPQKEKEILDEIESYLWEDEVGEHYVEYLMSLDSEAIKNLVLERISYAISYIENPSDEECLLAVRSNALALAFIKPERQTEEICLEAVKHDSSVLEDVANQTEKICRVAVENIKPWEDKEYILNQIRDEKLRDLFK